MKCLDRYGWPVELIHGRPVLNLLRLMIHTRKIVPTWAPPAWVSEPDPNVKAQQPPSASAP